MEHLNVFFTQQHAPVEDALHQALASLPAPVQPIASHILNAGGKRLRPMLVVLVANALGYRQPDLYRLASSVELIHMASLLHDDVLDGAVLRRGQSAAHQQFGVNQAILAGDAILAHANFLITRFKNNALTACLADAISRTSSGEIMEIAAQRSLGSTAQYLEIIIGKTAWLMRAACELGALHAQADAILLEAIASYGLNLGIAFQIIDDALDFAPSAQTGKPCGGDLREGKYTPPVQLYTDSLQGAERADFIRHFQSGSFADAHINEISAAIQARGFDSQTRAMAQDYLNSAQSALEPLKPSPEKQLLFDILDMVRMRKA